MIFSKGHELLVPGVLFVRVRPVLNAKMEAMFHQNGVEPVKSFREIEIKPRRRVTYVNHMVWLYTAAIRTGKHAQGKLEGNQVLKAGYKLSKILFGSATDTAVDDFQKEIGFSSLEQGRNLSQTGTRRARTEGEQAVVSVSSG